MTTSHVSFPGFGLDFHLDRVAFRIFGISVYWYGLIIAAGFLLAVVYCYRKAPKLGIRSESLIDMLLFAVPLSIIGARLYYIIFYLDFFRKPDGSLDFMEMLLIRDGGLAIYGGIIAAVLTLFVFCRVKKYKFSAYLDIGAFGLLIGQAVGRWGNFMNVEAYGGETGLPWRMGIEVWSSQAGAYMPIEVHPTFLYESLWNVAGFFLLVLISKKWRKFDGQLFLTYVAWYGIGRTWIEGLRTDSLYFFGLELFGAPIRTSQVLAALSALVSIGLLIYHLAVRKHSPDELYCNRSPEPAVKEKRDGETAGEEEKTPELMEDIAEIIEETEEEQDDLVGREGPGGQEEK